MRLASLAVTAREFDMCVLWNWQRGLSLRFSRLKVRMDTLSHIGIAQIAVSWARSKIYPWGLRIPTVQRYGRSAHR